MGRLVDSNCIMGCLLPNLKENKMKETERERDEEVSRKEVGF